jgi:hypothetical protein
VRLQVLTGVRWILPAVIAVAIALVLPSVRAGLHADDYVLLGILSESDAMRGGYPSRLDIFNFFDGKAERTRRLLDLGVLPWWSFPTAQMAFWRPVSAATHWFDFALWRNAPTLMHLHSVLWFGSLIVVTYCAYRRLMGRVTAAMVATIFYALDGAHAGAIGWISGRNTILGAFFGTMVLIVHDRWRREGSRLAGVLSPVCLVLALLNAEGAVAILAYLFAHALFLERGGWDRRLWALAPCGVVVVAWQLLYAWLGYGVLGVAPAYVNPVREPLEFAAALARNGPLLLRAQWTGPSAESATVGWMVTLLILIVVGALLAPVLRQDPVARFWGLGQILAVVPLGAATPQDRYLFFVGLGAAGLLAQFVCGLIERAPWRARWRPWKWSAIPLACVLVFIHLVISPIRLAQGAAIAPDAALERIADSIASDSAARRQCIVILNVPNAPIVSFTFFVRAYKGEPIPAQIRVLTAGDGAVGVYRADARTLRVRWQGRQEHMLFRDKEHPMMSGERIRVAGMDVEVNAVTDGWPTETTFRFDQNLDDPELRWLQWASGGFVRFRPPAVGETLVFR